MLSAKKFRYLKPISKPMLKRMPAKRKMRAFLQLNLKILEVFQLLLIIVAATNSILAQGCKLDSNVAEFGLDKIIDTGVDGLVVQAVVIYPEGIGTGCGGDRPIDRRLATALE